MIIGGRVFPDIDSALSFFGYTYQEIMDIALGLGTSPEVALNYTVTGDVRQSDSDIYSSEIAVSIGNLGGATRSLYKQQVADNSLLERVRNEYSEQGLVAALSVLPKSLESAIYSYYTSKLLDNYIETLSSLSEQLNIYLNQLQCLDVTDVRSKTLITNLIDSIHNQLVSNEKILSRMLDLRASSTGYYRKYGNRKEIRYCINQIEFNDADRQTVLKRVQSRRFKNIAILTSITKSQSILNKVRKALH